jgi:hypothetical protein
MQVCEWAVQENNASQVHQFAEWVDTHPRVKAIVYFDFDHTGSTGVNYRLAQYVDAAFAYRVRFAQAARYHPIWDA